MKTKFVLLALGLFCLMGYHKTQAEIITIEISGFITEGYGSIWGGDVYVGAGFTGIYTYESSTPDTNTSENAGLYVHDSPYGLSILLGNYEFKTSPSHSEQFMIAIIDNGPNLDSYRVDSYQNADLANGASVDTFFWATGGSDSMLSSDELPVDAPNVEQWPGLLHIYGKDTLNNGYLIRGSVTQATVVPEPLTITFLATAGAFFLRRKR